MLSMQVFMTEILMATLALLGVNASIGDSTIASTITLTGGSAGITTSTAPTTTSNGAISTSPNAGPSPRPSDMAGGPCYSEGETWDQLGTWDEINRALQNSGIVRVTFIPGGYHVNENIEVNSHCFVFEIGVNVGNSVDMTPSMITDLLSSAHKKCAHGGRWDLKFVAGDGGITGKGWAKADPQKNADCS